MPWWNALLCINYDIIIGRIRKRNPSVFIYLKYFTNVVEAAVWTLLVVPPCNFMVPEGAGYLTTIASKGSKGQISGHMAAIYDKMALFLSHMYQVNSQSTILTKLIWGMLLKLLLLNYYKN